MAVLLITHDLGVVAGFVDRLAVMYAGEIVETGPTEDALDNPFHPYTLGLLRSLPRLDRPRQAALTPDRGLAAGPRRPTSKGCPFRPRCPFSVEESAETDPPLQLVAPNHWAACWNPQGRREIAR